MNEYFVRIELHGSPSKQTYDRLHLAMRAAGFSQLVMSSEGYVGWVWLPHAEYNRSTTRSCDEVRLDARTAVETVSTDYELIVVKCAGEWKSRNLRPATAQEIKDHGLS